MRKEHGSAPNLAVLNIHIKKSIHTNLKRIKIGDLLVSKGKRLWITGLARYYQLLLRKVPVLQINGDRPGLNESLEIMKILNGMGLNCGLFGTKTVHSWYWFPMQENQTRKEKSNYKLSPAENFDEAISLSKNFDSKITNAWYSFIFGAVEKDVLTDGWIEFISSLDFSSGDFFGGGTDLGYVDITVLPWMNRMDCLYAHKRYCLSEELDSVNFNKLGFKIRWLKSVWGLERYLDRMNLKPNLSIENGAKLFWNILRYQRPFKIHSKMWT